MFFDLIMRYSDANDPVVHIPGLMARQGFNLYRLVMRILQWLVLAGIVPNGTPHSAAALAAWFAPGNGSFLTVRLLEVHESATTKAFMDRRFTLLPMGAAAVGAPSFTGKELIDQAAARVAARAGTRSVIGHASCDRAAGRNWRAAFRYAAAVPGLRFAMYDLIAVRRVLVPNGWLVALFLNTLPRLPRNALALFLQDPLHPRYAMLAGFLAAVL